MYSFHPFGLFPDAWGSGEFLWDSAGPLEMEREQEMTDEETRLAWMQRTSTGRQSFLLDREDELQGEGPAHAHHPRRRDVQRDRQRPTPARHGTIVRSSTIFVTGGQDIRVPLDVEVLAEDMRLPATIC